MSDLKTYIIRGKVVCVGRTLTVKRAKVKNCFTQLHAKSKFEDACKKKYPNLIRVEISDCHWNNFGIGSIFESLGVKI